MKIDEAQVRHVAKLAKLSLSEEEVSRFAAQLSDITEYVEKINEMETDGVEPAEHIAGIKNVFRQDEAVAGLPRSETEALAPEFAQGHIVVPKVIE